MATGIQTGIRRGSRLSATPALAQQEQGLLARCLARWGALSRSVKIAIVMVAVAMNLALVTAGLYSRQVGYVDLYPTKLQPHEMPEISQALLEHHIEHQVAPTNDGLLVGKQDRLRARSVLASRNLPLHRVLTPGEVTPNMSRTAAERKALEQRLLEGEITLALREVDGVRDARVKLSQPETSYIAGDNDVTRASVTLMVEPGHQMNQQNISGLLNLVAFSVPGLTPENVSLVDTRGLDLATQVSTKLDQAQPTSSAHFQVRSAEETRIQDKLQDTLDTIMPGRTKVMVSLDLDFAEAERRLYTPGSDKDDGLVRDSFQLVTEILDTEKGEKETKGFENRKEAVNYKYTENYLHTLSRFARVERINATVFADGISAREAESLKESVMTSVGAQESRGDRVTIDRTSWDRTLFTPPVEALEPTLLSLDKADTPPLSTPGLMGLLLLQSAVMLAGFAGYLSLSGRHRSGPSIEGGAVMDLPNTGIVDHGLSKFGQTATESRATGVQTTELLEGLVRSRPTQVADLLRSTWLSRGAP